MAKLKYSTVHVHLKFSKLKGGAELYFDVLCCSRKIPYPSHGEIFDLSSPPVIPLEMSGFFSYFPLKHFGFWDLHPLLKFPNILPPWGGYGYFLESYPLTETFFQWQFLHNGQLGLFQAVHLVLRRMLDWCVQQRQILEFQANLPSKNYLSPKSCSLLFLICNIIILFYVFRVSLKDRRLDTYLYLHLPWLYITDIGNVFKWFIIWCANFYYNWKVKCQIFGENKWISTIKYWGHSM